MERQWVHSGLQGKIPVLSTSIPPLPSPKPSFDPTCLTKDFPVGMVEDSQQVLLWTSLFLWWRKPPYSCHKVLVSHLQLLRLLLISTRTWLATAIMRQIGLRGHIWLHCEFTSSFFYCKAFFLPQPALENLISGLITTPMLRPGWPLLAHVLSLPSLVNIILGLRSAGPVPLPPRTTASPRSTQGLFLFPYSNKIELWKHCKFSASRGSSLSNK